MTTPSSPTPPSEPSVLDYVKSLLSGQPLHIPSEDEKLLITNYQDTSSEDQSPALRHSSGQVSSLQSSNSLILESPAPPTPFPFRSLLAFLLAIIGQFTFEPASAANDGASLGYAFYLIAIGFLIWAIYAGEWTLHPLAETSEGTDPLTYRLLALIASIALGFLAYTQFASHLFEFSNTVLWSFSIIFLLFAFWVGRGNRLTSLFGRIGDFFTHDSWTFNISRHTLLLIAATALIVFFRFSQTESVPPEPISDHAEKVLDVYEVAQGAHHVFFIRNTGREAFQMYWSVLVGNLFGIGYSFITLKLGTALLGFLTLPFIYLLAKEIGGPRVALIAFIMVGIGYWPNVISRVGLRFPLYPLFVAPTLLFLIRGLRTRNRNDFLLSGLFLGIGLHGYSPFRIVPFVVIVAFVLYWVHAQSQGARRELPIWLVLIGLTSLLVFIPLLRYWVDDPAMFGFRAMTRLSNIETEITDPTWKIFLSNLWNAMRMFNFDDGEIWVHSIRHRPALDVISAALFAIGAVMVFIRYIRNHHWLDIFLLASIPLLAMPSILSIAFPRENPALNRAGAAYIPVFIIGALALDGLLTSLGRGKMRSVLAWGMAGLLLFISANQNYDLTFRQYKESYGGASWNTSDMGREVQKFEQTYGRTDTVWIVPFPHWVDTRLPAVWAGIPNRDMAMWQENLPSTVNFAGPKLFIVKANPEDPNTNDQASLDILRALYPEGQLRLFDSPTPGHDFWLFFVPEQ